jgi:hypothetical protein
VRKKWDVGLPQLFPRGEEEGTSSCMSDPPSSTDRSAMSNSELKRKSSPVQAEEEADGKAQDVKRAKAGENGETDSKAAADGLNDAEFDAEEDYEGEESGEEESDEEGDEESDEEESDEEGGACVCDICMHHFVPACPSVCICVSSPPPCRRRRRAADGRRGAEAGGGVRCVCLHECCRH